MAKTTSHAVDADRVVKSNGVKAWCTRNTGWALDGNAISKHYKFGNESEAARFASMSVRRASKSAIQLTLKIHASDVTLAVVPSGADFTSNDLTAARRFDLKPRTT